MKKNLKINGWLGLLVGAGKAFSFVRQRFSFNKDDDPEPLFIGSTGHAPNEPPPPNK